MVDPSESEALYEEISLENMSLSSVQPVLSNSAQDDGKGGDQQVEDAQDEGEISGEELANPVLDPYFVACQKGDLKTVKEMIENGLVNINEDHDPVEKVTGLHWASINNRLSVVAHLVACGADVNAKAGALRAPPLHWAARYGYVYIVDYLLEHGADPTLKDEQGFNLLHLAVTSSNIMLVLYVLFFVVSKGIIDVDCQDPNGRTPLLWAAYQGDSLTVEALLRFGAYPKVPDSGGFTSLHWGTLKGQPHVLMYLIQKGGDFFQKTNDGKDCFAIAQEMNTTYSLNEALNHCGFDSQGYPLKKLFEKSYHAKLVTFFTPWVFLAVVFGLFTQIHPLLALPVTIVFALATSKALNKFVLTSFEVDGVSQLTLLKTPLYAGVFSGSLFLATVVWIRKILPWTLLEEFWANVILAMSLLAITYHFIKLLQADPGSIPPERDYEAVRQTTSELLKSGKFDTRHFCIESWVRKPLRSRYSTFNKTLVARFDHYCPWVYNDVGLKNHKRFIFFIGLLEIAICIFASLCMEYFDELEDSKEDYNGELKCFWLIGDELCAGLNFDLFTTLVLLWAVFQAIWVGFLILVQAFQIFKGVTNYEFSKVMRDRKRMNMSNANFNEVFSTAPEDLDQDSNKSPSDSIPATDSTNDQTRLEPRNSTTRRCFGTFCAITGMDQWLIVLKEAIGISRNALGTPNSSALSLPTNYGWRTNLKDFWLNSDRTAPLWQRIFYTPRTSKALLAGKEVDYDKLYSYPEK
ncbi:hypothetical protein HG536_0A06480 [Torulaspora globosa]|uniref:Palmitoyltransferase n=1 Tax=Torulaspora globosa TaxID=48254 RepID=A0A7G3ZBE7_9SACH|nr:uncharacterized protein HG536_0A06480 [Torulaspora globosa]QLL30833.1 hypothetical protein HG536_0A06480 [Torulaspora globosa]